MSQAVRKRREEETARLGVSDMWTDEQSEGDATFEDPPAGGQLQVTCLSYVQINENIDP